jgi:AcrR family transcriptional regulator
MVTRQRLVNLQRAILDASLELISRRGIGALSMREVSRRLGVTHGAPYHHFRDRGAILAALTEEGFERLEQELRAAAGRADDPREQFEALGRAYVAFAVSSPSYFRLMFRPELAGKGKHPGIERASERAFGVLEEVVEACHAQGYGRGIPAKALALTGWTASHGLAALCVDGQLSGESPAALARMMSATVSKLLTVK